MTDETRFDFEPSHACAVSFQSGDVFVLRTLSLRSPEHETEIRERFAIAFGDNARLLILTGGDSLSVFTEMRA